MSNLKHCLMLTKARSVDRGHTHRPHRGSAGPVQGQPAAELANLYRRDLLGSLRLWSSKTL